MFSIAYLYCGWLIDRLATNTKQGEEAYLHGQCTPHLLNSSGHGITWYLNTLIATNIIIGRDCPYSHSCLSIGAFHCEALKTFDS